MRCWFPSVGEEEYEGGWVRVAIAVFGPVLRLSVYSTRRFSFTCSGIKKTFSEHAKGHGIPLFSLAFRYVPGKFYAEAGAASRKRGIRPAFVAPYWQFIGEVPAKETIDPDQLVRPATRLRLSIPTVRRSRSDAHCPLGSVAPTVIRAPQTEALLAGQTLSHDLIKQAQETVMREVSPISDLRSTEHYRRTISGNVLAKCLRQLGRG